MIREMGVLVPLGINIPIFPKDIPIFYEIIIKG